MQGQGAGSDVIEKQETAGTLRIVPLQEEHIEALAALEQEVFSQPWSERAFRELLTRDYCHYLVAELAEEGDGEEKGAGHPVGMAGMLILSGEGDIDKVMVAPDVRRLGIADRLLKELLQSGRQQGVTEFTLEVRKSNEAAIRLYEKNGFVQEGVRPRFYEKPVEDALILWNRQGAM